MLPSKELELRLRLMSRLREPSSDGMPPCKLLLNSWSVVREVRLAMQGDMEPVMPCEARSTAMTRRGDSMLQVTPCHSQNSTEAEALLHEAASPGGAERWDMKQRRAPRSFSVSSQVVPGSIRQETKAKRRRMETMPGDKTPEEAIVLYGSN